jgi:hypothetical protein
MTTQVRHAKSFSVNECSYLSTIQPSANGGNQAWPSAKTNGQAPQAEG